MCVRLRVFLCAARASYQHRWADKLDQLYGTQLYKGLPLQAELVKRLLVVPEDETKPLQSKLISSPGLTSGLRVNSRVFGALTRALFGAPRVMGGRPIALGSPSEDYYRLTPAYLNWLEPRLRRSPVPLE